MKNKKLLCVLICLMLAFFTGGTVFGIGGFKTVGADVPVTEYKNLAVNGDFENGTVSPFFVGGLTGGSETLSVSTDIKYAGDYALKFSGRTTTSTLNYSDYDIELGKDYVFTAWVYSSVPMWFNLQATVWGQYDSGSLWNTASAGGVLTEAATWTKLETEIKVYLQDNKLYISANGGEGVLAQDHSVDPKADTYRNVHHVDFEINALANLDTMYVDNVCIREKAYENGWVNLVANGGVESGKTDGYYTYAPTGATASVSAVTDKALDGSYSLKFDRTGTSQVYRSVYGLNANRKYTFTMYAYTDVATWANLIVTPWAVNGAGNMIWTDSSSTGFLLQAGLWTKLYCTYNIYTDADGKLWVDNGIAPIQALNHANYDDTSAFSYLQKVDFKFTALDNVTTVYIDEFTVYDTENPLYETDRTGNTDKTSIAFVGDSIIEGAGGSRPYSAILQDWLGTEEYLVRNYGWSGAAVTPTGALPYTSTIRYIESLYSDADIVFISLGLNDLYSQNYAYISEYESNLRAIVQTYLDLPSKPTVYVCSCTTTYEGNAGGYSDTLSLAELIPAQKRVAEALGCTFIDMHTPTENHSEWFGDGLHPNDTGYEQLAGIVYKVVTGEDAPIETPVEKPDDSDKVNLFKNAGFEDGNTRPFKTQGVITMGLEETETHTGDYSIKVTERGDVNSMVFQALAGTQIRLNEWYRFSAWIKSDATIWSSLIVTPWAVGQETGANIWIDSYGDTKIVQANVWTKLDCEFMLGVDDDGKLWVDNGIEKVYAKNWADTGDITYSSLIQVDFKINATMEASTIYMDDFRLTCNYEVSGGEIPDAPTGHGNNENTEAQLGQMFSNASFELDLFGTAASPNGAIWFTYSPCGVSQNTKYSHSGSASAEIFGRTTAKGQFLVNMNTIRISRTYTYSAYLSSRQATKGAICIEMFGYKFHEDGTRSDPSALYHTEFKSIDHTGWTYFEMTFRYERDGEDLVLYVNDEEVGRAVDSTDLSCFTFGFITDEQDENYLTDMYMDTCSLMDKTGSDKSDINSGEVEKLPFEDGDEHIPEKEEKSGCKSSFGFSGAILFVFLSGIYTFERRKKRGA